MKKRTNLQILKDLVNADVLECVKLRRYGVQAYNIVKGEEYCVIKAFAKQKNRYYFIDRENRRFLASHYDRAEWLAGEVLAVLAEDKEVVVETVDLLERSGSVLVCAALLVPFFEECDRRNLTVKSTATGVDELARMLTLYELVKQSDNNESDNNDNDPQSNKDEQTAAEPSALAQKVAKVAENVKACAVKARALRPALVLYVWGVIIAALFALCFVALPFVCVLVPYIFITAPTFKPTDIICIISLEAIFIAVGVVIWRMFKNGDFYSSWHDCKILTRPF